MDDILSWCKHPKTMFFSAFWVVTFFLASQTNILAEGQTMNPAKDVRGIFTRQQIDSHPDWKATLPGVLENSTPDFPRRDWWRLFQDADLDKAIERAIDNNPDLKSLEAQIGQAQANSKIFRSRLLPKLSFNPQYTWEKLGQNQFVFPIQNRTYQVFTLPLNAQWETDFFGKNLAAYRGKKEEIKVARFQYEAARIQLESMVASSYFNIAKWRKLESLAQEELQRSDKLLSLSQHLLASGQATLFDIQNAQQRRDQSQVNVTGYANNRELAENTLLALMGQSPTSHTVPTVSALENLAYPQNINTGVPSDLLVHRPDLAIAEAQLSAAHFNVQAARKALLPNVILNGSTGYNAVGIKNIFNATSWSTLGAATLAQSLYAGGQLKAQIQLSKMEYQQTLTRYESALIAAFTDTENSLATLHANQVIYRDVQTQTENARAKAKLQASRSRAGLDGQPLWLAEDVQRLEYEKRLAQQKTQLLIDIVSVAKALGGGFKN